MIQHSEIKSEDAMNAIGWNDKAKMDELMDQVLTQQLRQPTSC